MGEADEGVEVFRNLFGGFSGSLSLFTNNPYQRGNVADVAGAPNLSPSEKGDSEGPLKKVKKLIGKEDSRKTLTEVIVRAAEKKQKKKRNEIDNGAPDPKSKLQDVAEKSSAAEDGASVDVKEGLESVKKTTKKKVLVPVDVGGSTGAVPSNAVLTQPPKELSIVKKEKEKRSKRKVVEEEIQEEFEKKFRGSDGKKTKSEAYVQGVHSEDPEIDSILLQESLQEVTKKQSKRKFADEDDGRAVRTKKKTKKTKKEIEVEEEKRRRTIFVGNLPTTVKKKHLIREFSQYGTVESARLRSVALVDTKLPRKAAVITGQLNEKRSSQNAYVVFQEEKTAKAALVHNMAEFQGKHVRVDMASAPRKASEPGVASESEYDRTRSLFVGNVPFDVEEEDLYQVFANDNPELSVEAIRVPRDPQTSISKGFGFVLFKTKAGANAAIAKKSTKIGERYLRVVRLGSQRLKVRPAAQDSGRSKNSAFASRRISERVTSTSKKGPQPWEGARAAKSDGKPGKGTLGRYALRQTPPGGTKTTDPAPKVRLTKRPAVLARKQAALFKAGKEPAPPKNAGSKRKNERGVGKAKKAKQ